MSKLAKRAVKYQGRGCIVSHNRQDKWLTCWLPDGCQKDSVIFSWFSIYQSYNFFERLAPIGTFVFKALCPHALGFLRLYFTQLLFHIFWPWSLNRQIEKRKWIILKVELNPGPPKHRITKQLLYLICYGSFKFKVTVLQWQRVKKKEQKVVVVKSFREK